jgi:hypothetical protein
MKGAIHSPIIDIRQFYVKSISGFSDFPQIRPITDTYAFQSLIESVRIVERYFWHGS